MSVEKKIAEINKDIAKILKEKHTESNDRILRGLVALREFLKKEKK